MKSKYVFLTAIMIISQFSCKKFLDTKVQDSVSPGNYYTTENQLNLALNGVYDMLGAADLYGERMTYRYGMEGDDGDYSINSPAVGPPQYNYTSADAEVNLFWVALYKGIARANILLDNVDNNPALSDTIRGKVKGEALFLRSYYYFLLVQNWGGVPLILKQVSPSQVNIPRATVKEVYDQILKDMTSAEGLVSDIRTIGFAGRVTKSAVRGILARVCLYMAGEPLKDVSKYKDASIWAKKVIDDLPAGHALIPNFSQVFINYAQDKYDISESIWEVEFWGNGTDTYTETGRFAWLAGAYCLNVATGQGNGYIRPTARFYQLFSPGDLRREWTTAAFTYDATGPSGAKTFIPPPATPSAMYNLYNTKFRREYETLLPKNRSLSPMNFPLLRYSDVLLMYAEAENEVNGPTQTAIDAVNLVRRRAWATGIKTVIITSGGSGYTTAPTVIFSGGSGSGAVATAVISGGKVTGLIFPGDEILGTKIGTGYTSAPTITFSGGGGSGAVATTTIYSKSDADLTSTQTSSKDNFRLMIQDERSRELAFEDLRKPDLLRWGIFVPTMQAIADQIDVQVPGAVYGAWFRNVTSKHLLLPIPAAEQSLNKAIVQNPGW
jgi:starch-binding outer membrane protein, SusD/RagB family